MKTLLKLITFPAALLMSVFVRLFSGVLYLSSFVFGLVSMVIGLLGLAVLLTYSVQNGIILLLIAFLVSPVGLPMAAVWLLSKVQALGDALRNV